MYLGSYLAMLQESERKLGEAFDQVATSHGDEPDVYFMCIQFAKTCTSASEAVAPFAGQYQHRKEDEPDRLFSDLFQGTRQGALALLRDLQDLYVMAQETDIGLTLVRQAAQGLNDIALLEMVDEWLAQVQEQIKWIQTRSKQAAPQALIAAR